WTGEIPILVYSSGGEFELPRCTVPPKFETAERREPKLVVRIDFQRARAKQTHIRGVRNRECSEGTNPLEVGVEVMDDRSRRFGIHRREGEVNPSIQIGSHERL